MIRIEAKAGMLGVRISQQVGDTWVPITNATAVRILPILPGECIMAEVTLMVGELDMDLAVIGGKSLHDLAALHGMKLVPV